MWVRGLKLVLVVAQFLTDVVAPRVGAWIETRRREMYCCISEVAPRVGAWIETVSLVYLITKYYVAPRVGAWIETDLTAVKHTP